MQLLLYFSHVVLNPWTRNVSFNIRSLTMLMCSDLSVNVFLIHVTVVFLPNALSAVLSLLSQGMELNTTAKTIIQVSVFSACSSAWTFICPSHSSGVLLIFCFANVVLHNLDNFSCYVFISKSFWCFSCTSTLEQMHCLGFTLSVVY